MAAFNKFNTFAERLAKGEFNLHTDTLKIYYTDAAPDAGADSVKADLAEITAQNGYPAGGMDTQNAVSLVGAVANVTGVDVVATASGGSFGPARYAVLYDDTHASDALIGWWDRGASVTPADGESLTTDFGTEMFKVNG